MAVNFTYEISLVILDIDVTKRHVEIITGKINSCFQKIIKVISVCPVTILFFVCLYSNKIKTK
jgi:hypothetical protein